MVDSQGLKSTLVLVLGPQSRIEHAPAPFRIRAVDSTFKRGQRIVSGKVVHPVSETKKVTNDGFDVPAKWNHGTVEVQVETLSGPALVVVNVPKIGEKKDLELVVVPWQAEQTQKPSVGNAAVYPMHGSARSSLQTEAIVVDEGSSDETKRIRLETLKTHVVWTELQDGSRLRASSIRQIIKLSTLQVQHELLGSIQSEENESAYVDFYIDGRLRKMMKFNLVKGENPFQISLENWGPLPQDGLLVMRLSTSFAQKETGALAFARVHPSLTNLASTTLLSWTKSVFLDHGGNENSSLLRFLSSSTDDFKGGGVSDVLVVRALLSRLNATKWRPRTCSPSLAEQEKQQETRRQAAVKKHQWRFRFASAFSCILLLLQQLLALSLRRKERRVFLEEVEDEHLVEEINDDNTEMHETLSVLKTAKGAERWLAFGITAAAFGMLGILDWVLTALAKGDIAF
ncbi:MAG: hypothetical protein GY822_06515 [Deltaproteobacteria bacterium]|nr:hypothetical protein [Deltaproteobacteria bacterium]